MLNYYEILGLQKGAGIPEVKAAFRQLAKLYHPDINPAGREQFTVILKAYEVLSDPQLKYSYDYKLNSVSATGPATTARKNTGEKNWKFDEREMKRRQYYNDHIKKYEKKSSFTRTEESPKSSYNEFKYILLATPLAVLLFIGIMSLASGNTKIPPGKSSTAVKAVVGPVNDLKMGDSPYVWHFGKQKYEQENNSELSVQNLTGTDAIICLFDGHGFVRSFFVKNNYSATISQLPDEILHIRYSTGQNFNQSAAMPGTTVTGAFTSDLAFYKSRVGFEPGKINQLTLMPGVNEGFRKIGAEEFFNKR